MVSKLADEVVVLAVCELLGVASLAAVTTGLAVLVAMLAVVLLTRMILKAMCV